MSVPVAPRIRVSESRRTPGGSLRFPRSACNISFRFIATSSSIYRKSPFAGSGIPFFGAYRIIEALARLRALEFTRTRLTPRADFFDKLLAARDLRLRNKFHETPRNAAVPPSVPAPHFASAISLTPSLPLLIPARRKSAAFPASFAYHRTSHVIGSFGERCSRTEVEICNKHRRERFNK